MALLTTVLQRVAPSGVSVTHGLPMYSLYKRPESGKLISINPIGRKLNRRLVEPTASFFTPYFHEPLWKPRPVKLMYHIPQKEHWILLLNVLLHFSMREYSGISRFEGNTMHKGRLNTLFKLHLVGIRSIVLSQCCLHFSS